MHFSDLDCGEVGDVFVWVLVLGAVSIRDERINRSPTECSAASFRLVWEQHLISASEGKNLL